MLENSFWIDAVLERFFQSVVWRLVLRINKWPCLEHARRLNHSSWCSRELTVVSSSSFNSSEESSSVQPTGLWSNPFLGWACTAREEESNSAALSTLSFRQQRPLSGVCADVFDDMVSDWLCLDKNQPKSLGSWDSFAWGSVFQRLVVTSEYIFLIHRKCFWFTGTGSLGVACKCS